MICLFFELLFFQINSSALPALAELLDRRRVCVGVSGSAPHILPKETDMRFSRAWVQGLPTVSPIKLEIGLRPNSAGIPCTLLLRIEAMGLPTFRLLL